MAEHTRQHYLSQSYLRGFADRGREAAIWQYCKSTNQIRLKGIHKIAQRRNFYSIENQSGHYDHTLERWFGTIESWWPSVFRKIGSNLEAVNVRAKPVRITEDDRVKLLQYMLIHFLRVPKNMDLMGQYVEEHVPRNSDITARGARNVRVYGLENTYDSVVEQWVELLKSRELTIEATVAGSGVTLFTCDNPVIIHNPQGPDGITYDTTHVLFPVSRRSFVRWAGARLMRDAIMVKVHHKREVIDDFNRHVVEKSSDEVYTANPHQLSCLMRGFGRYPNLRVPTD